MPNVLGDQDEAIRAKGKLEKELERQRRECEQLLRDREAQKNDLDKKKGQVKELKELVELGMSRESKLIQLSRERRIAIFRSLKRASPSMRDEDALQISIGIDTFEDFEHEDALRAEVTKYALSLHHGRWFTDFGSFYALPQDEQDPLKHAVEKEIVEQKKLFPTRRIVQEVCSKHLDDFAPELEEELAQALRDMAADASLKKINCLQKAFFRRLSSVIQELEKRNIDVEGALLDSWKPLALIRSLSMFIFLDEARAKLLGEDVGDDLGFTKVLLDIYRSIKKATAERYESLAASAVTP